MAKNLLFLVVGLGLGIGIGWGLFAHDLSAGGQPERTDEARMPPSPPLPSVKLPRLSHPDEASADQRALPATEELVQLRRRVEELEASLSISEDFRREQKGAAEVEPPPHLPERFRNAKAIEQAVEATARRAGLTVDFEVSCNEYPCLVVGRGARSNEDFANLVETTLGAPYDIDDHTGATVGQLTDAGMQWSIGIGIYPAEEPTRREEAIRQRLIERLRAALRR
ncbi:MAG: hypothetical protein ACOZIN_05525 [Myxococcota bacterium]